MSCNCIGNTKILPLPLGIIIHSGDRSQTIRMVGISQAEPCPLPTLTKVVLRATCIWFPCFLSSRQKQPMCRLPFWLPVSLIGRETELTAQQIATAQEWDSLLSTVQKQLQTDPMSVSSSSEWKKFTLRRYKQLWRQLILSNLGVRHFKKLGHTDDDLKRGKIPWVTLGSILSKWYHV